MPTWLELTFLAFAIGAPVVFIRALARAGRRRVDADFGTHAPASPPGDAK